MSELSDGDVSLQQVPGMKGLRDFDASIFDSLARFWEDLISWERLTTELFSFFGSV